MRRREFIGLIGTAAMGLAPAYGQTRSELPLVGLMLPLKSDAPSAANRVATLRNGMKEAGFIEGTNYSLAVRYAEGDVNRYPQIAKELADQLKCKVIVAVGFVNAGIGLGGIAPLVATGEIRARGIPGAFLFLAGCLALPFFLTLVATRHRGTAKPQEGASRPARTAPSAGQLLRMPMFWIFGVSLFFAAHAMLAIQQHLVLYLTGQGVAAPRAALALSTAIWSSAAGKLLSGATADRFSARPAMMLSVLYVGLGVAGVLTVPSFTSCSMSFSPRPSMSMARRAAKCMIHSARCARHLSTPPVHL